MRPDPRDGDGSKDKMHYLPGRVNLSLVAGPSVRDVPSSHALVSRPDSQKGGWNFPPIYRVSGACIQPSESHRLTDVTIVAQVPKRGSIIHRHWCLIRSIAHACSLTIYPLSKRLKSPYLTSFRGVRVNSYRILGVLSQLPYNF